MTADNIARTDVMCEDGYEKHQVISEIQFPEGVLSDSELNDLNRIIHSFISFGSVEISNYSHEEKGYSLISQGEIISYFYMKDINLN